MKQPNVPTIFIIFGITGHLAKTRLIPALYHLYAQGVLPRNFSIIGFSRRPFDRAAFQKLIRSYIAHVPASPTVTSFVKLCSYHQGQFHDRQSYHALAAKLGYIDKEWRACASKLYYLAAPPKNYATLFTNLAHSGLTTNCSTEEGWTRVLVEKPFGSDVRTAEKLESLLSRSFKEEQIFRVDHYLAKETVQNILTFRFSNSIFEPIWNSQHIEKVHIRALEKDDVGSRGAFYDEIGALRDFGQSHLLQMLALIAMENPRNLQADAIRRERATVLNALQPRMLRSIESIATRGQYHGYTTSKGVAKNSQTETYFMVKAQLRSKRWRGVPFYLESGKGLSETMSDIAVYFKESPCFCQGPHADHKHRNVIHFHIKPHEGIAIRFWAKMPKLKGDIEPRELSFDYRDTPARTSEGYEKLLYDAINGDQTLFPSTHEVAASWRFIEPILKAWKKVPLVKYKKGTMPILNKEL